MNKIYVGNLHYDVTEDQVRALFAKHGEVDDVALATEKGNNKPRGFAFVFMRDDREARAAIGSLNGFRFEGRPLRVKQARAKGDPPEPPKRQPRGRPRSSRRPVGRGYSSNPSRGYRGRGDSRGGGGGGNR